jgi:hypothetical protein
MAARVWGEKTPSEDREIPPSPHSPPPEDLPSLGDLFSQQTGISVGARKIKRPWMGTRG